MRKASAITEGKKNRLPPKEKEVEHVICVVGITNRRSRGNVCSKRKDEGAAVIQGGALRLSGGRLSPDVVPKHS